MALNAEVIQGRNEDSLNTYTQGRLGEALHNFGPLYSCGCDNKLLSTPAPEESSPNTSNQQKSSWLSTKTICQVIRLLAHHRMNQFWSQMIRLLMNPSVII